jgi:hypothetical protein
MDITRDKIEQRLKALTDERDSLIARANMVIGCIQDCNYWLKVLALEEEVGANRPEITD